MYFMKIRPVLAELFHAYRRTYKVKSRLSQFCERAKNDSTLKVCLDHTQIYVLSSKVIPLDKMADASRTSPP